MNYLKITKYIYLGVGFIMIYDFVTRWNENPKPWLSAIIAGLAFITYFFRSKFAKKIENRNRHNNSN
jgi:hypothetical protein